MLPGIFSARGRRGGAVIAFWVRVSGLAACVGASHAQTPYFGFPRAFFPCELAEKGRFGGVPKGVKMGLLHENREKPSACFWRAFLGCPAVAGDFCDVRDRRSTDINFHLRFFCVWRMHLKYFLFSSKLGDPPWALWVH